MELKVYTSLTRDIPAGSFSPITSTLLIGRTEVAVVDTQFHYADVEAVGDLIEATGCHLTAIVITHAHGDHSLGSGRLAERFPGARFVATPAVATNLATNLERETAMAVALLGDNAAPLGSMPEPLDDPIIFLDGDELHVIDVGQGDITPSAIVHAPAIDSVCAGDVVYNRIHQMLGLSRPAAWADWLTSIAAIEALNPQTVVAGHKQLDADDDANRVLKETREYLLHFAAAYERAETAEDLVAAMTERFPRHGNLTTLQYSAHQVIRRRHLNRASDGGVAQS